MAETRAATTSITAIHQQMHDAFNRRDWDALRGRIAQDAVYTDHARGETATDPDAIVDLYRLWDDAFGDGEIEDVVFHQAGNVSVSQFVGRGTQDGQLGPFPPSGGYAETTFCEVLRFDDDGALVGGDMFYDQLSMLMQLGHIPTAET